MDCKALSVLSLFLLIAFLLMTFGSVTPCVYEAFDCGLNEKIDLLVSDDGSFSCIEWNGTDVHKCLLFIKTKRTDGIINFVISDSNIDGSLTIGHGEDPDNTSSRLQTVTNSTGWGENGIIYGFQLIWMAWSPTVGGKIKAQFQDLIFKQFPVTLHKEDNGTFSFPNTSCNYTYRPNSAYIWMLSTNAHCEGICNETTMDITVKQISPGLSGDALILGMGNKTQMFQGPNSLLLRENMTESLNVHLTLGEAFVILLTGRSYTESKINFKVIWRRNSTKPKNVTVELTTAMPDAWLQAISICIKNLSKEEFNQNITAFKDKMAEVAAKYANDENIVLASYKIRRENVEISDTYFFGLGKNESEGVQIILTIVEQHDKTKAVFRSKDILEMFSKQNYLKDLRKAGYEIINCSTNPDYVDWFWASCITFIFSISVLLIVWYIKMKNICETGGDGDTKSLLPKDKFQQRTVGNEYEESYYTRESFKNLAKDKVIENSAAHSEINTEDHAVTQAKKKIEKHSSDVSARRNLSKSNHLPVRPTSDPIRLQEMKNNLGVDSPKSILRKGVKADVVNNPVITEEPQENVAEHLYDTVENRKMVISGEPEQHYLNGVSIEDEIEDTRC